MDHNDVVSRYFAAINAEDWDSIAAVFHPEGVFSTPGARPRVGRDAIVALYRKLFTRWAEHIDKPRRIVHDGDTAVVEIVFCGRTTRGQEVTFDAIDVFTVEDGLIRSCTSWFDSLALHRAVSGSEVAP